jgi:multidrug efflux pump subunit AcrA (membrane-fusion protein)
MKAVTTLTLALMLANPVTAEMYRWVDDSGNVYYTDRIPPDRINSDRTIINKHGIEVETISPDRPEDIARKQLQEKLVSAQQELLKRRESEDSNLLQQYRSEEEILDKRKQHVRTFDIQIHGVESNIKRISHKLIALQTEIDERQQKGMKADEGKLQILSQMHERVKRETARVQALEEKKQDVIEEYIADLERFRFLKQVERESSNKIPPATLLLTAEDLQQSANLYLCTPDQDCETQWQQAADYLSSLSNTPVTISEPDLLLTREPDDDDQIGLRLIRSPAEANLGTWIFLDLNCRETRKGYMYCKSDQADRIRAGFKQYLQKHEHIALKE